MKIYFFAAYIGATPSVVGRLPGQSGMAGVSYVGKKWRNTGKK
jgi:hypothetical protein